MNWNDTPTASFVDNLHHYHIDRLQALMEENTRQIQNENLSGHVRWTMSKENEAIRAELFKRANPGYRLCDGSDVTQAYRRLIPNNECHVFIIDDNGNEIRLMDYEVNVTQMRLIKPLLVPGVHPLDLRHVSHDTQCIMSATMAEIQRLRQISRQNEWNVEMRSDE